jgi:seryl-tRNA synthetase
MLDITFIRENPDIVRAAIKNKNREGIDLDRALSLADERKALAGKISDLNGEKNANAKKFGPGMDDAAKASVQAEGTRIKEDIAKLEEQYAALEKELVSILVKIPNIPSADTPVGPDESGNKVIRTWGDPSISLGTGKPFTFTPKAHWDLGPALGIINSEKATEVSGARFTYLMGDLALMQFALIQFAMSVLTSREKLASIIQNAGLSVSDKPFVPAIVPMLVKKSVQIRMARFLTPAEHYLFPEDDTMMIGSAEHTLGPIHMDETIKEGELPLRYVGYSSAFRREAGSYGKDTKGILRQHQFDKIEMETFVRPEDGIAEQDLLVAVQEYLLQALKLPYQVVLVCTGDMGFPDQRQIDIETWMPGQDTYRETNSADYVGGFQARRLNTRVKRNDGSLETIHMNDATAYAMGRTLIAIIENYQNEDGSITIPEALRAYMGGKEKIVK